MATRRKAGELIRAFLAGGAATIVDLALLIVLVSGCGVPSRIASIPALIAGGIVSFVANRRFVFHSARDGSLPKQAAFYVIVELVALALNGVLFDVAMRLPFIAPHASTWYLPARLVTSHLVFLAWSYPLWRLVFRGRVRRAIA